MKASEIARIIEDFAPLSLQENWDNAGFCIGSGEDEVTGLMIGFDCTPALIREAQQAGCNMVVTHHPLIFGGVKRISDATVTGRTIIEAIRAGVTVYSCHTNMDKVIGGVSGTTARAIGLKDVQVLDSDQEGRGLGIIGDLPERMSAVAFLHLLKSTLGLAALRHSQLPVGTIGRVALCGGSGRSLIGKAFAEGADAYLCGDLSYHDFYVPEDRLLVDIGHFESERKIVGVIFDMVREKFPNFAVRIASNGMINPVYYM